MDLGVAAPAEHSQFLLRQHGEDLFRAGRLMLRPYQLDGGLMESFAGGFAVLTQPSPHQQFKHRIPHVGQTDGTDAPKLVLRHTDLKVIFHDFSSHEKKICPGKSFKFCAYTTTNPGKMQVLFRKCSRAAHGGSPQELTDKNAAEPAMLAPLVIEYHAI